ncbi:MAG: hypothetical protein ACI4PW_08055 [Alphaproteobacteria bacterium]|jgi:hypothetical protein
MAYYIKFDRDGYGRDRYRDDYRRRDRDGYERDERGRFDDEKEYGSRRRRRHEYDDDDDYDDEGYGVEKYERDRPPLT